MLYHLWANEWKRVIKSPALLLMTLTIPISILLIVGMIVFSQFQEEFEEVEIIIIDEDETFETNALISQLAGDQTLAEQIQFVDGGNALAEHIENPGEAAAIIRIPEGFTEELRSGHNEQIDVYLNDAIPFSSQLAETFLESGQSYITSAQAGVNTVHHFYSNELEGEARSEALQQNTLHFTFLALGRNDLFEMHEGQTGDLLDWKHQLTLGALMFLYVATFILLASLFQPKESAAIQERLQLIQVTESKQRLARFFFHASFSLVYVSILVAVGSQVLESYLSIDWPYLFQWIFVSILICALFLMVDLLIRERAMKWFAFLLVVITVLLVNGFIIPPAYLPAMIQNAWLEPVRSLYTGFVSIISQERIPWMQWAIMIGFTAIMLFLNQVSGKKVNRL